jgi:predicted porin
MAGPANRIEGASGAIRPESAPRRRATVMLTSRDMGEMRLGRDYVPTYTLWSRHDPFTHVGVAGSNNFSSAAQQGPIRNAFGTSPNTTVRASNSVQYLLPGGWAGIEGGLMLAAGEGGAAANGQHKVIGGRIGWQGKSFGVHAGRVNTENDLTGGSKFKYSVVGANGILGPVKLTLAWRRYEHAQAEQTITMLGAITSLGAVDVKASYLKANMKGTVGSNVVDANDADQFGIGAVYNLSKRTALYAQASRIDNDGRATFVVPGGSALPAGGRSTGWEAGVRHNF